MSFLSGLFGNREKQPDSAEFQTLLDTSLRELQLKTATHQGTWRLGKSKRWDVDQSKGNLVFTFEDGIIVTCPAQIIGSFNSSANSWLWAWANPTIDDTLKRDSLRVRSYGEERKIGRLTEQKWEGSEDDAWKMTALACKLCGSEGAYRGPAGTTYIFMTFGKVELKKI